MTGSPISSVSLATGFRPMIIASCEPEREQPRRRLGRTQGRARRSVIRRRRSPGVFARIAALSADHAQTAATGCPRATRPRRRIFPSSPTDRPRRSDSRLDTGQPQRRRIYAHHSLLYDDLPAAMCELTLRHALTFGSSSRDEVQTHTGNCPFAVRNEAEEGAA